jgi:hypothetical protein
MNSGDIMFIFDKLSIVLTAEIDESIFFSQQKNLDPAIMKLIKIFFAISAIAIMILVAIITNTSSLEKSALADLKSIVLNSSNAIGTLHKKLVDLEMALQGLDKNFQTEVKDLNRKMDMSQTEVKDLRNLFVSSQKGQSAAADSALSIRENGRYIACGTLARSPRFEEPVVITNRHAVADLVERCHYEITVRTGGNVDIPISRWFVPQGNVDIAFGLLAHPPLIPALNITSRADVVPGLHIWAFSVQRTGLVALDGRVSSTLVNPYQLLTNVGGVPGFSGTGYVDYAGTLSVVHVGDAADKIRRRRSAQDEEVNFAHFSRDCLKGTRLGMTGMGSHIEACLDLVSKNPVGTPEQAAAAAAAAIATRRRCVEGWSILAIGNLKRAPPDFAESCATVFANPATDNETIRSCELGWRKECGRACDFISSCLSFASGKPVDDQEKPAMREVCRSGWYDKYAEYATACKKYTSLRARNPEAEGVAAWVVDHPPFAFVDRLEKFPQQCKPM